MTLARSVTTHTCGDKVRCDRRHSGDNGIRSEAVYSGGGRVDRHETYICGDSRNCMQGILNVSTLLHITNKNFFLN